jgi:branched-chain amino acid transport system permease protein
MAVLGGTGSLIGPVFGAFIFEYIANVISGATLPVIGQVGSLWRLILGAAFVTIVWVFPQGVYGGLADIKNAIVGRAVDAARSDDSEPPAGSGPEKGGDD